ncbi:hypothetical protein CGRA01v4_06540 [Colletotrichum graminicola]|nr:hypothetical protein CGRA01v4_06540 [Colletotrichum graminicola]
MIAEQVGVQTPPSVVPYLCSPRLPLRRPGVYYSHAYMAPDRTLPMPRPPVVPGLGLARQYSRRRVHRCGPSISSVVLWKSSHDSHDPHLTCYPLKKTSHQRGWRHTAACRAKMIIAAGGVSQTPACNLLLNSSQLHPSLLFLLATRSPPTRSWQTTQAWRPIFPVPRIGESDSEPGSSRCVYVCTRARSRPRLLSYFRPCFSSFLLVNEMPMGHTTLVAGPWSAASQPSPSHPHFVPNAKTLPSHRYLHLSLQTQHGPTPGLVYLTQFRIGAGGSAYVPLSFFRHASVLAMTHPCCKELSWSLGCGFEGSVRSRCTLQSTREHRRDNQ